MKLKFNLGTVVPFTAHWKFSITKPIALRFFICLNPKHSFYLDIVSFSSGIKDNYLKSHRWHKYILKRLT